MNSTEAMEYYSKFKTYTAEPITEEPLIDKIDNATLIAFFRCNSCTTCRFREQVIDKDKNPHHDIEFCSKMHDKVNLIDMVSYLGYSKEGRETDKVPRFEL